MPNEKPWYQRSKNSMILIDDKKPATVRIDNVFDNDGGKYPLSKLPEPVLKFSFTDDGQHIYIIDGQKNLRHYSVPLRMFLGQPLYTLREDVTSIIFSEFFSKQLSKEKKANFFL